MYDLLEEEEENREKRITPESVARGNPAVSRGYIVWDELVDGTNKEIFMYNYRDGEITQIPSNIGISVGKIVDTDLSGMRMSATHTHETDGTIHLENNNPSKKPESLTLGYFFYVWDKQFSSSCIFEYCTDKGELKMYVNGKENAEFENYIMRDKDEILIEYTSGAGE